mmetsp:Transcript_11802/g.24906  ORF Transcript_11802/g.24906 Transcript_11802/m.24906 type:complete len:923 (-) Transcript_11802:15-2783(-)
MSASTASIQKTTRICIKNVPPSFDETKLRRHLLESGPSTISSSNTFITDCRILKTKDGKSRKLAFVGFKTYDQATRVVDAFNGTYAKTSRLTVELAFSKKISAEDAGYRPWSKHSKGSSRYEREHAKHGEANKSSASKSDGKMRKGTDNEIEQEDEEVMRKKEEFLRLMGASTSATGGGKAKAWSNDAVGALDIGTKKSDTQAPENSGDKASDSDNDSDDDDDDDTSTSDNISVDSGGEGADALAGSRGAYAGAAISDMDFLRAKTTAKDELSDDEEEEDDDDDDERLKASGKEGRTKNGDESIASTDTSSSAPSSSSSSDEASDSDEEGDHGNEKATSDGTGDPPERTPLSEANEGEDGCARDRLFVRNLPFSATEEEVKEVFEAFGQVLGCHIPVDDSKKNKGYAFVKFGSYNDAFAAREALDGTDFQGRLMHVLPAKREREEDYGVGGNGTAGDASDAGSITYKKQQELARRQGADKESAGWSSSFVRGDAVIDNLSDRLGLAKGDILNVKEGLSSGGAAVRLALGETQIIEENREFFAQHGVDMDILVSGASKKHRSGKGDGTKRSKEMILVKNLPYDTTEDDLKQLFQGVGDAPARILLPPSRTIALIEYGHAVDAKRAFRRLAYKRFKHVPLYLEWAPLAAKQETDSKKDDFSDKETKEVNHPTDASNNSGDMDVDEHQGEHSIPSYTLYVKNLSFKTTEQQLLESFQSSGHQARAVRIPTKLAPVKKQVGRKLTGAEPEMKELSMGFGFVEFNNESAARQAMKKMRGTFLNGHALEIKLSGGGASKAARATKDVKAPASGGLKSKKLMVRNVPFQATRKEILQLFGTYGHLKKVRLPKKFDGTHRGFAFVEFLTSQEAENAMKALSSTHLYGRHLVLEWADDKEDIDALRDRAKRDADHFAKASAKPVNKKIRFD